MSTPLDIRPIVTSDDLTRGYITRYFAQHISTKRIYEVDKAQYNTFSLDPYYTTTKLPWVLINDKLSPPAYKNTKVVEYYNKQMPGLFRKLRNPEEYVPSVLVASPQEVLYAQPAPTSYGTFGTEVVVTGSTPPTGSYTALDVAAAELSYYVLRSDNTLWSWGYNGSGELGLGDWDDRPASPTQVTGSWESISVGAYSLLAIKTDNTLWGTGLNWDGRLGLGDETDRNTMTQVTGTGWEKVSTAIGYGDHTLAVKTDGTLWAWGGNGYGQLGIGSSGGDELTPIQVGSDTNWSYVHAGYDRSFALKTNGTLWSWGSNLSTALGQGDSDTNAVYTSPTQIGADTNWTKLSSGWAFTFALKSNGTLWVTGQNISYGFGVGSTDTNLQYNTFTQVGSATDWADISCGYEQCVARKTDGSIYTWGYNADGELGLGDTTNRASPTQVGSATGWTDISGGFYDALAVKNNVLTYWGWNFNDYLGTGNEPQLTPTSLSYSSNILY